jgi:hypothetical protein
MTLDEARRRAEIEAIGEGLSIIANDLVDFIKVSN